MLLNVSVEIEVEEDARRPFDSVRLFPFLIPFTRASSKCFLNNTNITTAIAQDTDVRRKKDSQQK